MNMERLTRIPLDVKTREELKALKRGGESYDDVLRRLMKEAKA